MSRKLPLILVLALPLAIPLSAGDKVKAGFTFQINQPGGDLKADTNDKTGGGLSFILPVNLGGGHVLRPRFDVNVYRISDHGRYSDDYREEVDFTAASLGVDYLFYVQRRYQGFYLSAGLNVTRWGLQYTTRDRHGSGLHTTSDYERNSTNLGAALGVGYQFNRWFGLELRAVGADYKGQEGLPLGSQGVSVNEVDRKGGALQFVAAFAW
jgi:hypothetical protein